MLHCKTLFSSFSWSRYSTHSTPNLLTCLLTIFKCLLHDVHCLCTHCNTFLIRSRSHFDLPLHCWMFAVKSHAVSVYLCCLYFCSRSWLPLGFWPTHLWKEADDLLDLTVRTEIQSAVTRPYFIFSNNIRDDIVAKLKGKYLASVSQIWGTHRFALHSEI